MLLLIAVMIVSQTLYSCLILFLEGYFDLLGHITQGWTGGRQEGVVLIYPLFH